MAPFKISLGLDVEEEGLDFGGDGNVVKEEAGGGITASRGGVGGVLCTRDVSRVYAPIVTLRQLENVAEDSVGGLVGT